MDSVATVVARTSTLSYHTSCQSTLPPAKQTRAMEPFLTAAGCVPSVHSRAGVPSISTQKL